MFKGEIFNHVQTLFSTYIMSWVGKYFIICDDERLYYSVQTIGTKLMIHDTVVKVLRADYEPFLYILNCISVFILSNICFKP